MFTLVLKASATVAIATIIAVTLTATPVSIYAQQAQQQGQMNFIANLSGKDMSTPVNTPATGTAEFHINENGSLCYQVRVNNIDGVLGAHINTKNGTELVDLINPYAVVNTQQVYPTGPVNGLLTSGEIRYGIRGPSSDVVFTYGGLLGPLIDKPVTALNDVIKNNSAYVTVRTLDHQTGEIQGQIVPTSSTVSCLTHARFGVPTTTPNVNNSLY
jgi:CHRD domain-containing protein